MTPSDRATTRLTHLFFDCDDCLYQNNWATANKITESIAAYTASLGVSKEQAYELYKTHGTCLKGLLVEGIIKPSAVEDFLINVHLIDYSEIDSNAPLRAVISSCLDRRRRFVFTASTREHAGRCLDRIGVADLFSGVVDTRTCTLETKHSEVSFRAAMQACGATDATTCVLFDDSVKNIRAAKALGWTTVLVGLTERDSGEPIVCPEADFAIGSLLELPTAMPELFQPSFERMRVLGEGIGDHCAATSAAEGCPVAQ